jgi:hypothetical protein
MADAPITFFIPLGKGRSNAGLTVRAESFDEMNAILEDITDSAGGEMSKLDSTLDSVLAINAALELKGLNTPEPAPSYPAKTSTHPQANASGPSDAPTCQHGPMKWKEGTSKQGNAYKGWFCAAPYGQVQCKAQFVK